MLLRFAALCSFISESAALFPIHTLFSANQKFQSYSVIFEEREKDYYLCLCDWVEIWTQAMWRIDEAAVNQRE